MNVFQKLRLSTIPASLLLLLLFQPFTGCTSYNEQHQANSHKTVKQTVNKVSPGKTFDIALHGILLWVSIGFLMPVGILTIRMSKEECSRTSHKSLFYTHAILQMLAVLLSTTGAVLSIKKFENSFDNSHQRIGLALYVAIWVQAMVGFLRPRRGNKSRSVWYFFHWILGTTICVAGILNIYTGLKAYHKRTSKSTSIWTILFTAQVSFMGFFYLFQDKWDYIKKQGMILGIEPITEPSVQVLPQTGTHKVVFTEPCRKSNALAKISALRKLFQ